MASLRCLLEFFREKCERFCRQEARQNKVLGSLRGSTKIGTTLGLTLTAWIMPGMALAEPQSTYIAAAAEQPATLAVQNSPADAPPMVVVTAMVKLALPPKPAITLQAKVDQIRQTLTLMEHGKTIATWRVSTGVADHATPRGVFQPEWSAKMWYSHTYDMAPMPHAVFFKGGAAVHATQSTGALGRAASHGCVRLAPANAEMFYKLVQRHGMAHTRIAVSGVPQYPNPIVARRDSHPPQRTQHAGYNGRLQQPVVGPMWGAAASRASGSAFAAPEYTRTTYASVRLR